MNKWQLIYRLSTVCLWVLSVTAIAAIVYPATLKHQLLKNHPDIRAREILNKQYEAQLDVIIARFTSVATEIAKQQLADIKNQLVAEIHDLSNERQDVERALTMDKTALAKALELEAEYINKNRSKELTISFVLGVLSSLAATFLVSSTNFIKRLKKKAE